MQEIVAQVVTQTGPKVSQALADLINKTKASGDRVSCDTIDGFLTYIEEMKPGRQMQPSDGARHQVNLYRLIQFFVNTQSNDFNNLFATILKIVDEFKDGAFNGRYAFRFTESMVLNKNDINSFTRFMNLLTTASAVKGRQEAIRQIDFNRTLEHGFTDEGKQRVLHFFNK